MSNFLVYFCCQLSTINGIPWNEDWLFSRYSPHTPDHMIVKLCQTKLSCFLLSKSTLVWDLLTKQVSAFSNSCVVNGPDILFFLFLALCKNLNPQASTLFAPFNVFLINSPSNSGAKSSLTQNKDSVLAFRSALTSSALSPVSCSTLGH